MNIETFVLRVRGEEIGKAMGDENVYRAVEFVCDRGARADTTPNWAIDAAADLDARDHWAPSWAVLSERPWRPE